MKYFNNVNSLDELERVYNLLIKDNPEAEDIIEEFEERSEQIKKIKSNFTHKASCKNEYYSYFMSDFFKEDKESDSVNLKYARILFKKLDKKTEIFKEEYVLGNEMVIKLIPNAGLSIENGCIIYKTTRYGLTGWWSKEYTDETVKEFFHNRKLKLESRKADIDDLWYSWKWSTMVKYKIKYKWRK